MDVQTIRHLIAQREDAATAAAQQLREQIAALTARLARAETELADLATTRTTLDALTGAPPEPATNAPAYSQILAVFTTTGDAMRAKDVCLALGLGTAPKDTEGLRAKLKRLVARQVLVETRPGLFALAPTAASAPGPRAQLVTPMSAHEGRRDPDTAYAQGASTASLASEQ